MKAAWVIRLVVVATAALAAAIFLVPSARGALAAKWDEFIIARANDQAARQQFGEAIAVLEGRAEDGSAEVQIALARIHVAAGDDMQALQWFERAWQAGDVQAGYELGKLYVDEAQPFHDVERGVEIWRSIADRHLGAAAEYGAMLVQGESVPRDVETGITLITRAAGAGDPAGLYYLGLYQQAGIGVERDAASARENLVASAQLGYLPARTRILDLAMSAAMEQSPDACDLIVPVVEMGASGVADAPEKRAFLMLAVDCAGLEAGDAAALLSRPEPAAQFYAARLLEIGRQDGLTLPNGATAASLYQDAATSGFQPAIDHLEAARRRARPPGAANLDGLQFDATRAVGGDGDFPGFEVQVYWRQYGRPPRLTINCQTSRRITFWQESSSIEDLSSFEAGTRVRIDDLGGAYLGFQIGSARYMQRIDPRNSWPRAPTRSGIRFVAPGVPCGEGVNYCRPIAELHRNGGLDTRFVSQAVSYSGGLYLMHPGRIPIRINISPMREFLSACDLAS